MSALAGTMASLPAVGGMTATLTVVHQGWKIDSLLTLSPKAVCSTQGGSLDIQCHS